MCMESRVTFAPNLLLLPRPWLEVSGDRIRCGQIFSLRGANNTLEIVADEWADRLFVRGYVHDGKNDIIVLPYWHKTVAMIAVRGVRDVASVTEQMEP